TDVFSLDLKAFEKILICVGRTSVSDRLGLEEIGIKTENNRIITNDYLATSEQGIYAAGDCTARIMLAHFAAYQGTLAAENIANSGNPNEQNSAYVPNCIFTDPEISSIGILEEEAKKKNIPIDVKKFDFLASGMARIFDETDGFIKLVSERDTGILIGASIIGPRATEIIATLTIAIQSKHTLEQLRNIIIAHPTLSEILTEALK
ncbi:MAG: FAD-dependent oxidoreductase, partial [Candidatus Omnitrophota bacterium]